VAHLVCKEIRSRSSRKLSSLKGTYYHNGLHQGEATQHRVPADRLTARKIGRFLRFGISTGPTVSGVGEGRKAAAERWPLGRYSAERDDLSSAQIGTKR